MKPTAIEKEYEDETIKAPFFPLILFLISPSSFEIARDRRRRRSSSKSVQLHASRTFDKANKSGFFFNVNVLL
jgi:hypothetical protein